MRCVAPSRYMRPGTAILLDSDCLGGSSRGLSQQYHHPLGVESHLRFVGLESYWVEDQPMYPLDLGQMIFVPR